MSNSNKEIKVLHITQWYPTPEDPVKGIFIQRHIQSLDNICAQEVWHLEISATLKNPDIHSDKNYLRHRTAPWINRWRIIEYQYAIILARLLIKHKIQERFTHVIFHIAYPVLTHFKKFQKFLPKNIVAQEQWSAYHFLFGLKKINHRIAAIFRNQIHVIVVSKSLAKDIEFYSGRNKDVSIIPNVVDMNIFHLGKEKRGDHYFMVALWKLPKQPLWPVQALVELREKGVIKKIRIGGYGQQEAELRKFVVDNKLHDQVTFLGKLNPERVAEEMRNAAAFLIPTEYETFSAVVAEALCSGCPVIASKAGAIPELLNAENGILVEDSWSNAMFKFDTKHFDHNKIAQQAIERFSMESVGKLYYAILRDSDVFKE